MAEIGEGIVCLPFREGQDFSMFIQSRYLHAFQSKQNRWCLNAYETAIHALKSSQIRMNTLHLDGCRYTPENQDVPAKGAISGRLPTTIFQGTCDFSGGVDI